MATKNPFMTAIKSRDSSENDKETKSSTGGNPFLEALNTRDSWFESERKKQEKDRVRQQEEQQKKQAQENMDAEVKKSKDEVASPNNILGDINNAAKGVGNFLFGGTAKLANQGLAVIEKGAVNTKGEFQKATGNKKEGEKTIKEGEKSIDERLLKKGKGLFGAGGIYESGEALHNADTREVVKKAAGTGLEAASEVLPIGAGIKVGKAAGTVAEKIIKGAVQGAAGSAVGSVGSQVAEHGSVDIGKTASDTALGGVLGGTIGAVAHGIGKMLLNKAAAKAEERLGRKLTPKETENLVSQTTKVISEKNLDEAAPPLRTAVPASVEDTLLTAAKSQAEKRLGRELNPQELDNLTIQTQKIVAEKMPTPPVETPQVQSTVPESAPLTPSVDPTLPSPELKPLEVPKVEGNTISGNAARIEQRSLEKKLTEKMGDLPQYKSINMKEQAKEAIDLIGTDKQHAIDIIEGKAQPPGNLKAHSVHQALEDLAVKEGDGELLTKLAKSHINTELSESAQNLRIAAERDPHSAVEQIRQIKDARVKAAEKRSKTTVSSEAKDIRKKVESATPRATKQDWNSFIKELTC